MANVGFYLNEVNEFMSEFKKLTLHLNLNNTNNGKTFKSIHQQNN